jgi:hypothetical protein
MQNYKLIYWGIWSSGVTLIVVALFIGNGHYFFAHPFKFLIFSLLSSLPFFGLAVYARNVIKNTMITPCYRNIKLAGVSGAFALTCMYGVWTFSSVIHDALHPASFFIFLAVGVMFVGYIIGGLTYVLVTKILLQKPEIVQQSHMSRSRNSTDGKD